ncbi:MAG: hypothetical protein IJ900_03210 [Paludibacteraceae bacterium]|nr:hypothetical protein [Paludibacteraceae bacterium]
MDRKTLFYIIEWSVTLVACAYLVYRLIVFDDYASLWETFRSMGMPQLFAIILCVALMPVNMALEAWRWKTLVPMSWREANRQVYYSKLAGLITPWRLGEYPARGVLMAQSEKSEFSNLNSEFSKDLWTQVLSMGAVGSATMTAAIVLAGCVGIAFSPAVLTILGNSYLYALGGVVLVLAVVYALFPKALKKYVALNYPLLLESTMQSLVRLACWCVQLGLVLYALGAISNLKFQISNVLIYYLLVTITPNVPIAEVGVRGAWAITLFGSMNAGFAGVLLWAINTLLPCLIWPFLRKKDK